MLASMAGSASNRRLAEKSSDLQKNRQNVSNVNQGMYSMRGLNSG